MEKTLKKICGMLSGDDSRRSAAALVLAELAPKNADVVKQLGQALPDAGPTASGHILDAMHAIGSKEAIPYVMPLLRSDSMNVRMRAIAVAASAGTAVAPEIKRTLAQSTRQEKLISIDLLARIPKPQTYSVLLDIISNSDFGLAKETCEAVQRHISSASPEARLALHKQVAAFMQTPKAKQRDRVITSCLLLLGHIGRREAATVLLKYAVPQKKKDPSKMNVHMRSDPNYIRRHALIGLKGLDLAGKTAENLVTKVLPYLDDPDEDIMRQALGIVSRLPASGVTTARWRKLLKNRHSSVRSYATRKLADNDTADTNRLLLSLLASGDNDVSDVAAAALSRHKKSVPVLLQALSTSKSLDDAWRIARILKPHSEAIDKKTVTKFKKLVAKEALAGTARHDALAYFLRNIDQGASEAVLLDVGLQHKKARRWRPAIDSLRRLLHTDSWNDDVSYDLSVCDLKLSHKELAPQLRAKDYALRGFSSLVRRSPDKLLKRLAADRILDASDLYYVGFHFSEGSIEYKTFGEDLLRAVAKKWPRSKEAKAVPKNLKKGRASAKKAATAKKPAVRKKPATKKKAKKKPAARKKPSAKKAASKKKPPAKKAAARKATRKPAKKKPTARKRPTKRRK